MTVWERLAAEGLELHEISGDHMAILKERHMQPWAEILNIEIARAQVMKLTIRRWSKGQRFRVSSIPQRD
jgi:hypothetical protein